MSCRLVSHLTGSPNRITPARFGGNCLETHSIQKPPTNKTPPVLGCPGKYSYHWNMAGAKASVCTSLHHVHHWFQILAHGTGKSCFYPAFSSSKAASWLHPLNMLPMDSSELTAHH